MSGDETVIDIAPAFRGAMVPSDLLKTEATIHFVISPSDIAAGGILFIVRHKKFIFSLSVRNNRIVIRRNEVVSNLTLEEFAVQATPIRVFVMWSPTSLTLDCGITADKRKETRVETRPVAPPIELIRWVRKNNLVEVPSYQTEEQFRQKVYSCLASINDKISEADAFKSFWNITYEGNAIKSRSPKSEPELQPLVHCLLSDQMLQSNIEVVPEYKTGSGNIDFLFMANVENIGIRKMCVEFKLAHSQNLEHGLMVQLPAYMSAAHATYGAYCVLSFKGDWFDRPKLPEGKDLESLLNEMLLKSENPFHRNIRQFVLDFSKPLTASQK